MIFMRMGDDEAKQLIAPAGNERRVRHHDIDLGVRCAAKTDPAIDREPFPVATVEVEIHADLARPTQRQEGQVFGVKVHWSLVLPRVAGAQPGGSDRVQARMHCRMTAKVGR